METFTGRCQKLRQIILYCSFLHQLMFVVNVGASFSDLTAEQPASAYNYTAILATTATRTTGNATLTWTINGTDVYQIDDSLTQTATTVFATKYQPFISILIFKSSPTSVYMELSVKLQLFMDTLPVQVSDLTDSTNAIYLNVSECVAENNTCATSTVSHSPCGLGCNITYTCTNGCSGETVTAFCSQDATWSNSPRCTKKEHLSQLEICLIICSVSLFIGILLGCLWDTFKDLCCCCAYRCEDTCYLICSCRSEETLCFKCFCKHKDCLSCGYRCGEDNSCCCVRCSCNSKVEDQPS